MRTLHVAALPFPSPQGTQGLLHAMLSALGAHGGDTHLLCYAHGAAEAAGPYTVHRSAAQGARSLRSGPSVDKLWCDLSLARCLPRLVARLKPDLVVAHHVEAAACALAVRAYSAPPLVFVAHTSLRAELPSYFPLALTPLLRAAGGRLDVLLTRRAPRTLAVSPLLAELLSAESGRAVAALPLPWPVPPPLAPGERERARSERGLAPDHEVVLYAGNLDAYQGLDQLWPALARLAPRRPRLRLVIATASPTRGLRSQLAGSGLAARADFAPLDDELARRRAHALADLVVVPRRSAGGVPIKLLDALARAVPVVAAERALAGLPLAPYCGVPPASTAAAWERAIDDVLAAPEPARARAAEGRSFVARELTDARFVAALAAHARALNALAPDAGQV